jgi:putative peptidoglycan lipid II flippase
MHTPLSKKSIMRKTIQVASSTLLSRFLGLIRTIFEIKYLGAGALSDAFWTAYKIPNTLRKVFAEGALSAAFIPRLVHIVKAKEYTEANRLMTLMLMVVEGVVIVICLLVVYFAQPVILWTAPGFAHKAVELSTAVPLLRIVMFFIFFISSSALLAGALQATHHFFIPSFAPVLLNIVYIIGLVICLYWKLPIFCFAFFIILGGLLQFLLHLYMYFKLQFGFAWPTRVTVGYFKQVMVKFLPCLFTMSAMEINFFIDSMLASYLPAGSISLINYSSGFVRIPLGIFGVAFSTILLPHFSRLSSYAPKRLSFYLLESSKLIFFLTIPALVLMSFFSYNIFYTIFLSDKFSLAQVHEASQLLVALLLGLFFFSLNKIILSMYYSLNETFLPTIITFIGTLCNTVFNLLAMRSLGALGLALGTSFGAAVQTCLFVFFLHRKFDFTLYVFRFLEFIMRFIIQLGILGIVFWALYKVCLLVIKGLPEPYPYFLLDTIGFWLWTGPLSLALFGLLYMTRRVFNLKLYFLD